MIFEVILPKIWDLLSKSVSISLKSVSIATNKKTGLIFNDHLMNSKGGPPLTSISLKAPISLFSAL